MQWRSCHVLDQNRCCSPSFPPPTASLPCAHLLSTCSCPFGKIPRGDRWLKSVSPASFSDTVRYCNTPVQRKTNFHVGEALSCSSSLSGSHRGAAGCQWHPSASNIKGVWSPAPVHVEDSLSFELPFSLSFSISIQSSLTEYSLSYHFLLRAVHAWIPPRQSGGVFGWVLCYRAFCYLVANP